MDVHILSSFLVAQAPVWLTCSCKAFRIFFAKQTLIWIHLSPSDAEFWKKPGDEFPAAEFFLLRWCWEVLCYRTRFPRYETLGCKLGVADPMIVSAPIRSVVSSRSREVCLMRAILENRFGGGKGIRRGEKLYSWNVTFWEKFVVHNGSITANGPAEMLWCEAVQAPHHCSTPQCPLISLLFCREHG